MDQKQKVVGVVFFGAVARVAAVTSPQLLDVVWCSSVVVVAGASCSGAVAVM